MRTPELRSAALHLRKRLTEGVRLRVDEPVLQQRAVDAWLVRLGALQWLATRGWHPPLTAAREALIALSHGYEERWPGVFAPLDSALEALLPDHLDEIVQALQIALPDATTEAEALGWLYQFALAPRKDAALARKGTVAAQDVATVTQLFTPKWLAGYLVENALGKLWPTGDPVALPYRLNGDTPGKPLNVARLEDIRVIDPAAGAGHLLCAAFDLLYALYAAEGYPHDAIAGLILEHNLVGLDICPHVTQVGRLTLFFKALERTPAAFRRGLPTPRLHALHDVTVSPADLARYASAESLTDADATDLLLLAQDFAHAGTLGGLIVPRLPLDRILVLQATLTERMPADLNLHERLLRVCAWATELSAQHHIVLCNPPYLGSNAFSTELKSHMTRVNGAARTDLFALFMPRLLALAVPNGFVSLVTMQSWMFLASFQRLRTALLDRAWLQSLVHLGPHAFDALPGEVVQTAAFVLRNWPHDAPSLFVPLLTGANELAKEQALRAVARDLSHHPHHLIDVRALTRIPGRPLAYWAGDRTCAVFARVPALGAFAPTRLGMATADNARFVRYWWQVPRAQFAATCASRETAKSSGATWFPYAKGGPWRKWYGNNLWVVNWRDDGAEIRSHCAGNGGVRAHNFNLDRIFAPGITWNALASSRTSMRLLDCALFDNAGSACFAPEGSREALLAFLNSALPNHFLRILSPTLNFQPGDIARLPLLPEVLSHPALCENALACVALARADWDSHELSWDFHGSPLLQPAVRGATLEASWQNWRSHCAAAIAQMQALETANNRILIDAYALHGEVDGDVPQADITLTRADARRDVAAFVSYVIGCALGRFRPLHGTLQVHTAIGPDDLLVALKSVLTAAFGATTVAHNLHFIETALELDLTTYATRQFARDHALMYKNRPIYQVLLTHSSKVQITLSPPSTETP